MSTRYLILGMQRSGTTAVQDLVAGHPEVSGAREEVSTDFFTRGDSAFYYGPDAPTETPEMYGRLFDALSRREPEADVWGMKMAVTYPTQARTIVDGVRRYLPGLRVVLVRRADPLAALASIRRAIRTGAWHNTSGQRVKDVRLKLATVDILNHVADWREINAIFDELEDVFPTLRLEYEADIEQGDLEARTDIFEFIGVSAQLASWLKHRKLSPPLQEYVDNYEAAALLRDQALDLFESGMSRQDIIDRLGPGQVERWSERARYVARHPGVLRPSFWLPRVLSRS